MFGEVEEGFADEGTAGVEDGGGGFDGGVGGVIEAGAEGLDLVEGGGEGGGGGEVGGDADGGAAGGGYFVEEGGVALGGAGEEDCWVSVGWGEGVSW